MADRFNRLKNILSGTRARGKNPTERPSARQQRRVFDTFYKSAQAMWQQSMLGAAQRQERFRDYEEMDQSPEISTALNIFADDSTVLNEVGNLLDIESDDENIVKDLEELYYERLNLDDELWIWIRNLCKYGDNYLLLDIVEEQGVLGALQLPTVEIDREEGYDGDPNSVRFKWLSQGNTTFESYQISHLRVKGDDRFLPYGRSLLEPARKVWKQLTMAEDAMLIYRFTRAPERRIFYVDVGNIPPKDVAAYMQQARDELSRTPHVTESSGQIDMRFNPVSITEDLYIPVRGDRGSRVETLPGGCFTFDTKIPLLDGRTLELQEIIKEHGEGKQLWTYSCNPQTGKVAPGKITWAGKTRENADILRMTLDNGKVITCTTDHHFIRLNEDNTTTKMMAKDMQVGDSMMPFNVRNKAIKAAYKSDYQQIFDNESKEWKYTHRLVGEFIRPNRMIFSEDEKKILYGKVSSSLKKYYNALGKEDRNLIYERNVANFNKASLISAQNKKKNPEKYAKMYEIAGKNQSATKKMKFSQYHRDFLLKNNNLTQKDFVILAQSDADFMRELNTINHDCGSSWKKNTFTKNNLQTLLYDCGYNWQQLKVRNHKIVKIEFLSEKQDVGTLTIDGNEVVHNYHTFALDAGVFTFNSNQGDIEDINYIQNKLFVALGVPKSYLTAEQDLSGKGQLAQEDIKFARTIQRIQKIAVSELAKIGLIHLYLKGYDENEIYNFDLRLTNPSTVMEMMQLDLIDKRYDIAAKMKESGLVDMQYIQEEILALSNYEISKINFRIIDDARKKALLSKIESGESSESPPGTANQNNIGDEIGVSEESEESFSPSERNPMNVPDPTGHNGVPGAKDYTRKEATVNNNEDDEIGLSDKELFVINPNKLKKTSRKKNNIDIFDRTIVDCMKMNQQVGMLMESLKTDKEADKLKLSTFRKFKNVVMED